MVEFDRSAFISKFQEEAQDLLQRLNEGVIALEEDLQNAELIDEMLRDAHTLKGSSRMVGLIEISDIAHRLEDIIVKLRDGEMSYTPDLTDHFFEALDMIVFLAEGAGKGAETEVDLEPLLERLCAVSGDGTPSDTGGDDEDAEETAVEEPKDGDAAAAVEQDDLEETAANEQGTGAVMQSDDVLHSKIQSTIRIRTHQIDELLNLISEVVISQIKAEQRLVALRQGTTEFAEIWSAWLRLKSVFSSIPIEDDGLMAQVMSDLSSLDGLLADRRCELSAFSKDYADDISRTTMVVNDLQEHGMHLRMLPASTVFNTFPRAMRDLARSFRKDVRLILEGGETELDKKVLEEINDPLIHIMRNAVDHGIESEEDRVAMGKSAQGTIRMSARQEGDHIVIEVSDDGAGIDPDKVIAAAIRKNYISEAEARSMSPREAIYLIFEKGFSTSTIITEISGRGVGMDVVHEFIVEKLKGSLDVTSEIGKGSTFRLTIPLTLAIIRALMLRVGDQMYALPTTSVEETIRVHADEIIKVEGREVIRRQRRTIPLVRLSDILGVPAHGHEDKKVPIATVGFSGHRMGFIVDALVGEQQIVIKTLGTHLRKVDNVAGVTILGAGEIVPILNVPDLMENARYRAGQKVGGQVAVEERTGPRRILICEDSFTTRELERSIFEAAGYEVEIAMDGAQGLEKLKEGVDVDAVVTDVQMPNMDGFELTRQIKGDASLAETPVIIVTSLEREEEKAMGIDAGADAYITKSVFNQDTLLDTVEQLIW